MTHSTFGSPMTWTDGSAKNLQPLTALVLLVALTLLPMTSHAETPVLRKLTPILFAEDVQACADFWEAMGMTLVAEMPNVSDKPGLGFAILNRDGMEVMYQSFAAAEAGSPAAAEGVQRSILYLEVESLDAVLQTLEALAAPVVVPVHSTDYGSREIYVRDPAGNLIGFSQQGAAP